MLDAFIIARILRRFYHDRHMPSNIMSEFEKTGVHDWHLCTDSVNPLRNVLYFEDRRGVQGETVQDRL